MALFQLSGLPASPFDSLFALSDQELRTIGAMRTVVDAQPGYPCRVSLADAEVGAEVLLLTWQHQPANSPYRASGPIYVRRHARQRVLRPGSVPACVSSRLISLRAYDGADVMVDASVCEGAEVALQLELLFAQERVGYVHLHNAKRGCYSCLAQRVATPGLTGVLAARA